jgi:hypothetical protein
MVNLLYNTYNMQQGKNFNRFVPQKPKSFTTASLFETQADEIVRRAQNLKLTQNIDLTNQNLPNVNSEIIDAEIIEDNYTENEDTQVDLNRDNKITKYDSILDIPEVDLARIVAYSSLSMEDRRKDELAEIEKKIETRNSNISKLRETKAMLEKYLHIQESAIEVNSDLILSDSDKENLTKIKDRIRKVEFDILINIDRKQYLINEKEGKYKYISDKTKIPYHDIIMTGFETADPEVIDIIISCIKQDTKYANNGRQRIFEPNVTYAGESFSLPEMAENIILNPNTTLEQAKKLVDSVSLSHKWTIVYKFLKLSPLLNPLPEERKSNTQIIDESKYSSYEERVTPLMEEIMDGLLYSTKQTAMLELNWSGLDQLRAALLHSFSVQKLKEKDPDKISLLENLKRIGATKIW